MTFHPAALQIIVTNDSQREFTTVAPARVPQPPQSSQSVGFPTSSVAAMQSPKTASHTPSLSELYRVQSRKSPAATLDHLEHRNHLVAPRKSRSSFRLFRVEVKRLQLTVVARLTRNRQVLQFVLLVKTPKNATTLKSLYHRLHFNTRRPNSTPSSSPIQR
jgi:hypothetical protein